MLRKAAPFVLAVAFGLSLALDGASASADGAPTGRWLPLVTVGAVLVLFPLVLAVTLWVGADPRASDGFAIVHWAAVAGFGLWSAVAIAFLALGYSSVVVWVSVVLGAGGLAVLFREYLLRIPRAATE